MQAHFEAQADDRLYLLMIPQAPYNRVLYVDGADATTELQTALSKNPSDLQCNGGGSGFDQVDAVWYADFQSTVEMDKSPFLLWEFTDIIEDSSTPWSTLAWLCDMDKGVMGSMVKPVARVSVNFA